MRRTKLTRVLLGALAAALPLAACGDDGDGDAAALEDVDRDSDTTEGTSGASDTSTTATTAGSSSDDGELPQFLSDFERVCSTQVGYEGATAYDPQGDGPHGLVLLEPFGADATLIDTSRTLPAGWLVEEDLDFEDNAELAAAELVACGVRVEETPNGTSCDFDADGDAVTLELVDTVVELTVHEAKTGAEVGSATLEASSTECPFFATFDPDDLRYFNEPTDEQYIEALRPFVEP